VEDVVADLMKGCPWQDPFYQLMYFNIKVSLPDDMLTKVDRMTMASSLEARVPFLDYRLVELMAQVDKTVKMPRLERKAVLRRTIGRRLPAKIQRAPKRGFVVPLRDWFKDGDLTGAPNTIGLTGCGMSAPAIADILTRHRSGQSDYGNLIWMLMVLDRTLKG